VINITIEGLDELKIGLGRITPSARNRIVGGALRTAAQAVQQEGNRRIWSPQGHARTFHVIVQGAKAYVGPGSRANFFSQRYRPVLVAAINAAHSRIENVIRDAVEGGIRDAFR
jgi:hypothetical protein